MVSVAYVDQMRVGRSASTGKALKASGKVSEILVVLTYVFGNFRLAAVRVPVPILIL